MTSSRTAAAEGNRRPRLSDPLSLESAILDFAETLTTAVERAVVERGEALIESIFSDMVSNKNDSWSRRRRALVTSLVDQLMKALARPIDVQLRARIREEMVSARREEREKRARERALGTLRRAGRPRTAPQPPPLDPEQLKRDAEFARLRALLKPTIDEPVEPAAAAPPPPPAAAPQRPVSPGDVLRALEKEIQDAVPSLAELGPERCGAQIAVWTGLVRQLRDSLPPDVAATMRPAFRIFLEHLTQLRVAMDAHLVDALEHNWRPPDWHSYIEVNRARVEQQAPNLPKSQLETHHRAMLKTLVMPHRRNVPQQALPIIEGAATVLPPDDGQLRSARRRHSKILQPLAPAPAAEAQVPVASIPEPAAAAALAADDVSAAFPDSLPSSDEEIPQPSSDSAADQQKKDDEEDYESLWTK